MKSLFAIGNWIILVLQETIKPITREVLLLLEANQHLSRKVYFTNYFKWIGEMREYGLIPYIWSSCSELADQGWVGNGKSIGLRLDILGEIKLSDIIFEAKVWVDDITGAL